NAEDNEYLEGVEPSLEFVITSRDITATGALATLLVFNNEKGFSPKNIESICSVGRSTKKGLRKRGIGFKSVFLITAHPYIFSNGYRIRFSEEPCSHCNLGYIVPEWVEENPTISLIQQIYGSGAALPTTTLVLPLKPDKVKPVEMQLSSLHPEVLLFLSKIKKLSVRENNEDPRLNTVSAISISSETNFVTRKNIDAESYMLHLSADVNDDDAEKECSYHMWRQRFPVRLENRVERRMEVEEWVITLAFPNGKRLQRGNQSPGIYAFLPTEMVTNFPFIIQADFLLASSRETILLDNKWNQGILDCVPLAFVNALTSLVKNTEGAPVSSLPRMFGFLPLNSSPYAQLNAVRESIKTKVVAESIVPRESYQEQKIFDKPCDVGRLMPAFWNILKKARNQGVYLDNISSHGRFILSSYFDREKYNDVLKFLEVRHVDDEWYATCIQSCNLVLGVSDDVYLELLAFLADKWNSCFHKTSIKNIPLLKYVGHDRDVSLVPLLNGGRVLVSSDPSHISWLIDWNKEFRCAADRFFLPKSTQEAMGLCSKRQSILEWLCNQMKVSSVNVYDYAILLGKSLVDRKLVVAYAHFLYHSLSQNYLSRQQVEYLCSIMPLVDNYGRVTTGRAGVLVPANGSRWVELIGSNPWRAEGYVELAEDYLRSGNYVDLLTLERELVKFLKSHVAASDIPYLSPPNAVVPTFSAPLTKQNALLLLEWIQYLRRYGIPIPTNFLTCIKEGSWLKVSLNGSPAYKPPSQSFVPDSSWGDLLQNGLVLVDIPLIDLDFYGGKLNGYKEELRTIGLMFEYKEACQYIGKHLMSLAASSTLTRGNVLSILNFIKFLRDSYLPLEDFVKAVKEGRWLRTSRGDRTPGGTVLFDQEWKAASQISDIPFIDQDYYGEEILSFRTELQLVGVVVGFNQSHKLVVDNLKSPARITSLTAEGVLLILECIRHFGSADKFVQALKDKKCIKTQMGFKSPAECFLFDPEWACLLQIFNSFPLIDKNFYGSSILSYKNELKQLGLVVNFEEAAKAFARVFKKQASLFSIGKGNVLSLLECYRRLMRAETRFPSDLQNCFLEVKWLRTRLGDYRAPKECILFGPDWESISPISLLPFIDDSDNYYGKGIREYEKELESMGVVAAFKSGAKFVEAGLYLPQNPRTITPSNVYSLLECIRNLQQEHNGSISEAFLKKLGKKWLKTHAGYRPPVECLLFDSGWGSFLWRQDGPFIDEKFYGSKITAYRKELNAIGVTIDYKHGCPLLANYLDHHSNFATINRIYSYLCKFNWKPHDEDTKRIWIPNGSENGEWVGAGECVLHDKNDLFSLQLNVLEKHYKQELLNFFSGVLGVKSSPVLDDYCKLWKVWEDCGDGLSHAECCAFWGFVVKHWNSRTEEKLTQNMSKVPVSGSDGILLVEKHDVFIADDLYLQDLFEQASAHPLFVWYPQPSLQSLPRTRLLEIYGKIGVQTLSGSVEKELSDLEDVGLEEVDWMDAFYGGGICRLILGFLADPALNMEAERRHDVVRRLLNVDVFETIEPITVGYSLSLSSGEILNVKASRMIRWERESSKFFTQKRDMSGGYKERIEYASYFSEVVAEGVLWEDEDHIYQLTELIKLGCLLGFDDEAIAFLMKKNNLQIFLEDEEFLSSAFTSD
ncbi:unnamed protein product, partial [Ilex paraguariensis]